MWTRWPTTRWYDKVFGEIGTLEDVVMSDLIDNKIFLFMGHRGCRYMGVMGFDDIGFCNHLFEILMLNRGLSIKQIGGLDLSHTL